MKPHALIMARFHWHTHAPCGGRVAFLLLGAWLCLLDATTPYAAGETALTVFLYMVCACALMQDASVLLAEGQKDPLTGLCNRRALDCRLSLELASCMRLQAPLTVLMVDVDGLKAINDRLGHGAGDLALRLVAEGLSHVCRSGDLACRVGGDEFVLLAPATSFREGTLLERRLKERVAQHPVAGAQLSVSVGVATRTPHQQLDAPELLLARADQALYATRRGRPSCTARAARALPR